MNRSTASPGEPTDICSASAPRAERPPLSPVTVAGALCLSPLDRDAPDVWIPSSQGLEKAYRLC